MQFVHRAKGTTICKFLTTAEVYNKINLLKYVYTKHYPKIMIAETAVILSIIYKINFYS